MEIRVGKGTFTIFFLTMYFNKHKGTIQLRFHPIVTLWEFNSRTVILFTGNQNSKLYVKFPNFKV